MRITQSLTSSRYLTNINFLYFPFLLRCGPVYLAHETMKPLGRHFDVLIFLAPSPSTVPNTGVQYKCVGC